MSMAFDSRHDSRHPNMRLTSGLGIAQTLAWASSYYLPAILAIPMARDIGIPSTWVFALFSGALLLTAFLGPWVGRAIDRYGGRGILMASNIVLAGGLILMACAQNPWVLGLAWGVTGLGMAIGLYDAAFATLSRLLGTGARSPITGVTLVAGFASTLGWPLSTWFESEIGWRGACLAWAGLHLTLGLLLNYRLPSAERSVAAQAPVRDTPTPQKPRLTMALLAYVFAAGWFVSTALAAHLPRLLEASGVSLATAVAASTLVGPAQVTARLAEFGLLRNMHPIVSARFATLLHPLGAALLSFFGLPPIGFAIFHGAGNGLMTIASGTLPLALFGSRGYGRRQGLIIAPARIAQATSPLTFGLLIDRYGASSLLLTSLLMLLALLALLAISPNSQRSPASTAD
jgi:predicted MFS family arabinose efflux permease